MWMAGRLARPCLSSEVLSFAVGPCAGRSRLGSWVSPRTVRWSGDALNWRVRRGSAGYRTALTAKVGGARDGSGQSFGNAGPVGWEGAKRRRMAMMRPKQSLGQNFLVDKNIIRKIVNAVPVPDDDEGGRSVVEVGPGMGALTIPLFEKYPQMAVVEIDRRAVAHLREVCPGLEIKFGDVLDVDWGMLRRERGERPLNVVGNLPYNIVSQIMFSLLESPGSVRTAIVMMQKEVAERIIAKSGTKAFGILSVIAQLYSKPRILFPVPNTCFYPKPDVTSAMVRFDFVRHPRLDIFNETLTGGLRQVVRQAFQQRRKAMRNSLKGVLQDNGGQTLPDHWASKRPEQLEPVEFIDMTEYIFEKDLKEKAMEGFGRTDKQQVGDSVELPTVWRKRATHEFRTY